VRKTLADTSPPTTSLTYSLMSLLVTSRQREPFL
jgi:hypothetical protein